MSRMFNLKELLEGKQSVALGGHVRPDGDCVGSTMGLYLYLKENFRRLRQICIWNQFRRLTV